jgi:hypothetical protein
MKNSYDTPDIIMGVIIEKRRNGISYEKIAD